MLFRSDRKSTRLNSSHTIISYAVFCLKKKTRIGGQEPESCTGARHSIAGNCSHSRHPPPLLPRLRSPPLPPLCPRTAAFFFFNDRATPESSPLPLPDPLPS